MEQAEFAYNNSVNQSAGKIPFQVVYGYNPRGVDELGDTVDLNRKSVVAEDCAEYIHELHKEMKNTLEKSTIKYKEHVDVHRRVQEFYIGELVMAHLRKERFPQGTYNKLKWKKIGPCKVMWKFSSNAYEIELTVSVDISPIFNVVDLYKYLEGESSGQHSTSSDFPDVQYWMHQLPKKQCEKIDQIIDS